MLSKTIKQEESSSKLGGKSKRKGEAGEVPQAHGQAWAAEGKAKVAGLHREGHPCF